MLSTPSYPDSRVVETIYGKVQGRRLIHQGDKQANAFQGIPFASPPVGELRFKKPVPPASWEGIRRTKKFAARSIQDPSNPQDYAINGIPSEDCLYLNVFTPCWDAPEGGFPVMVFIHGGAFVSGEASSYGDINICENIVSRGIVFVTIQYRLGYLGFFTTGDSTCPGNFALWDQAEALKWIQMNIHAFGGNKNNITLVGQSAGAACVDMLHLSPHSTGLFHKAICMAGTAECRWATNSDMVKQSAEKVRRLGITEYGNSDELLTKLRAIPAEQFGVGLFTQIMHDEDTDFETQPNLDGDFFPESFDKLRVKAIPKPIMTGVTKEEGLLLMQGMKSNNEGLQTTMKLATLKKKIKETLSKELRDKFIGDIKQDDGDKFMRALAGITADSMFLAGTLELCRKTVELQKEPVFLYVFEHYTPANMGFLSNLLPLQEATHTCELFYLFKKSLFGEVPITEMEAHIINIYTTACTNFAKYGNPNSDDGFDSDFPERWKSIDRENYSQNFVFTSTEPYMSNQFFEGRTADFINILNHHE
ncbi:hypothetical protein PFISCL1PPCAC_14532 [Pristionchus fissidentatus]|uniref:Carboxylic ester hydrolase n=1 Tax=Pristionchus fissidentatus TaxID=1538716 RepID=A0AAV5VYT7_9BILA|nr:hypothetical protein PFISCL1PPCAC_14532 [Pristionchus fissidentatus]